PTTITFSNGVATASGGSNGEMTLYKTETATIDASDGAGTGTTTGQKTPTPLVVVVGSNTPDHLVLSATSLTPPVGVNDALTITAEDAFTNLASSYTGSKNLTFSGANTIGTFKPTVTNSSGTPKAFLTATAITFSGGTATRQMNLVLAEGPITI